MLTLLMRAIVTRASNMTRVRYLNTAEGVADLNNLALTYIALLNADFDDAIVAGNGRSFEQNEYSVLGEISTLWNASRVYCSKKSMTRRNASIFSADIEVPSDFDGRVLTPKELDIVHARLNEMNKAEFVVNKLEGTKGVEFYSLKGFKNGNFICEGNTEGSIPCEVSVLLNYEHPYANVAALIDDVDQEALMSWLISTK